LALGPSIHGDSSDNVWLSAVGSDAFIWRWNGTSWQVISEGVSFEAIWTFGPDDVFGIRYGTFMHYNGETWSDLTPGTWSNMRALWGAAPRDLFIAGFGLLRYN
jgi:hypothetical protein